MERSNGQSPTRNDERARPGDGAELDAQPEPTFRIGRDHDAARQDGATRQSQGGPTGSPSEVEVITVDESWWRTRKKQGVHVLNPTSKVLEHAKSVALRAGTNTVYRYKKL